MSPHPIAGFASSRPRQGDQRNILAYLLDKIVNGNGALFPTTTTNPKAEKVDGLDTILL